MALEPVSPHTRAALKGNARGGCWTTFHDTAVRPRIMHHMPPVKQASSLFRPGPGVRNCIAWFSKQEVRKKLLEQGQKSAHVARGRLSRQVTRILASNCCSHFHLIHACHLYLLYTIQWEAPTQMQPVQLSIWPISQSKEPRVPFSSDLSSGAQVYLLFTTGETPAHRVTYRRHLKQPR